MYLAKDAGTQPSSFSITASRRVTQRLDLENRLRHALDEKQLELFYQPQVGHPPGELIGMEALIRWRQPDGSMIPPDKFIPIAEECGLIVPIGAWVLQEACQQIQRWLREGICRVPVGVNLSARQFDDTGLLDTIKSALANANLPPAYLDLELTESLVMQPRAHPRRPAECKKIGLQLSRTTSGTGYSSLANLKRFPIDRLKIDRSFIKRYRYRTRRRRHRPDHRGHGAHPASGSHCGRRRNRSPARTAAPLALRRLPGLPRAAAPSAPRT